MCCDLTSWGLPCLFQELSACFWLCNGVAPRTTGLTPKFGARSWVLSYSLPALWRYKFTDRTSEPRKVDVVYLLLTRNSALIPPRIISQRTVLTSVIFQALLYTGINVHFYYLPYYFQVVKGTDATQSGIRTIPYVASISLFAIVAGALVEFAGFIAPFLWVSSGLFTISAGLMYTLQVNSPQRMWIGFQVLAGAGAGIGLLMPLLAVQCSVDETDLPIGNAMVGFFWTLGSSIGLSVSQSIFSNSLGRGLAAIPGLDSKKIIDAGARGVRDATPPQMLTSVLQAYNDSIIAVFAFAIAAGGSAFLCSLLVEWKSVKSQSERPTDLPQERHSEAGSSSV